MANTNTNVQARPMVYKMFASPGIDSPVEEFGVYNSGAGRAPDTETGKASPTDWLNDNPTLDSDNNLFVAGFTGTRSGGAANLAIRRRGLAPFGGFFPGRRMDISHQHSGGIVDHNAGADRLIAGGAGEASMFCRVNVGSQKVNRGAKLPILPLQLPRAGVSPLPSGGGSHEPLTAPLQPKISGWPTIFSFTVKK